MRKKKSACYTRNDSVWVAERSGNVGAPINCYTENRGSDDRYAETEAGSRGGAPEAGAGQRNDGGGLPAFHGGRSRASDGAGELVGGRARGSVRSVVCGASPHSAAF